MVHYERVPICSDEESDDCENNSGFNEKQWSTIIVLLCVILSITCMQNENPTETVNKRYVSHKREFWDLWLRAFWKCQFRYTYDVVPLS
eukprot:UN02632